MLRFSAPLFSFIHFINEFWKGSCSAVSHHPQVLFWGAAFWPIFPKPVALHWVVLAQMQDPALLPVDPIIPSEGQKSLAG